MEASQDLEDRYENQAVNFNTRNSMFYPIKSRTPEMEKFHISVESELWEQFNSTKKNINISNLTRAQRTALEELKNMGGVLFKMSDKGVTVVVLNKSDYHCYIMAMLNYEITYIKSH